MISRDRLSFDPSPVSPTGEKLVAPVTNFNLETEQPHHPEKGLNTMPSPLGEVQTVTPINRHYQGEVHPTQDRLSFDPSPVSPKGEKPRHS
jgi:hypothetical protein